MMLIDLLILAAIDCAIRPDAGERWAEFTCAEQVSNALISMPPTPYDALVWIRELEREGYEKTQQCADLIEIMDRDSDALRRLYRDARTQAHACPNE